MRYKVSVRVLQWFWRFFFVFSLSYLLRGVVVQVSASSCVLIVLSPARFLNLDSFVNF